MISAVKPDEPASNFQQRDNAVPSIATTASLPCSETTVTFTLLLWMTESTFSGHALVPQHRGFDGLIWGSA
jgi:hypothetical protein